MVDATAAQPNNNFNGGNSGTSENPPVDPCLYYYYTYAQNIDYQAGGTNTIQLTGGPQTGRYYVGGLTLGYMMDHGGVVHLHIFPNGSDTWTIQELDLTLNFEDGVQHVVKFQNITLAQYSTETTLYFDGSFTGK